MHNLRALIVIAIIYIIKLKTAHPLVKRYFFLITFLICSTASARQEIKPILKIATSINEGYTNQDGTGLYWKIIEEIFHKHYKIEKITTHWVKAKQLVSSGEADILLGITSQDETQFIYSSSHIAKTYPIYAYYQKDRFTINSFADLNNMSVALRKGSAIENLITDKSKVYKVESIYQVDKLILNQRVDIALAYSFNTHLVSPENLLDNRKVIDEKFVYLAFTNNEKGQNLRTEFNDEMKKIIKSDQLFSLFPSDLEYQHADFNQIDDLNVIEWNLAPKIYNKKTKRLDVLKREVDFSQHLINQMPQMTFNIKTKSSKQQLENKSKTSCSIKSKRNNKQINNFYFSKPAHVYLKPKLFFLNKNIPDDLIRALNNTNTIKLNEFIAQNPHFRISVSINGNIYKDLNRYLNKSILNKLYIVDDLNYKNMMSLLLANRINAFIAWPTMVSELLDNKQDIQTFRSITIEENIGRNVYSYIGCTKSAKGEEVIARINQILSDSSHHQALFQKTLQQLDQDTRSEFIQLMNLNL